MQLVRLLLALPLAAPALAQTADFDVVPEGVVGPVYTENGLVFSDLDRYVGSSNEEFTIEDASTTLSGYLGFTPPNVLSFGTFFLPGGNTGWPRCGSFRITPAAPADSASLTLFVYASISAGNTITLEALSGGAVVASDSFLLPSAGTMSITLAVGGVGFDQLRVVGSGPQESGAFFGLLDHLSVDAPAPGSNYCLSEVNSTGGAALISAFGSASVAANDLVLRAAPVPDQPGVFYYGPSQDQTPFGNGFRCVGGTYGLLGVQNAVGNQMTRALDNTLPPLPSLQITPGSTWYFQAWFRDPAAGGASFDLSDGLEVSFLP